MLNERDVIDNCYINLQSMKMEVYKNTSMTLDLNTVIFVHYEKDKYIYMVCSFGNERLSVKYLFNNDEIRLTNQELHKPIINSFISDFSTLLTEEGYFLHSLCETPVLPYEYLLKIVSIQRFCIEKLNTHLKNKFKIKI